MADFGLATMELANLGQLNIADHSVRLVMLAMTIIFPEASASAAVAQQVAAANVGAVGRALQILARPCISKNEVRHDTLRQRPII